VTVPPRASDVAVGSAPSQAACNRRRNRLAPRIGSCIDPCGVRETRRDDPGTGRSPGRCAPARKARRVRDASRRALQPSKCGRCAEDSTPRRERRHQRRDVVRVDSIGNAQAHTTELELDNHCVVGGSTRSAHSNRQQPGRATRGSALRVKSPPPGLFGIIAPTQLFSGPHPLWLRPEGSVPSTGSFPTYT